MDRTLDIDRPRLGVAREGRSQLLTLVDAVRAVVSSHADWGETAELVTTQLRTHLPTAVVLTPKQRLGDPV